MFIFIWIMYFEFVLFAYITWFDLGLNVEFWGVLWGLAFSVFWVWFQFTFQVFNCGFWICLEVYLIALCCVDLSDSECCLCFLITCFGYV